MLASDVKARAYDIIQDATQLRWTQPEFLRWLSEAQREVVIRRPAANAVILVQPLVAGTKQALPAEGYVLLDIVRNMGTDGVTPGRPVRAVDRDQLDREIPGWHSEINRNRDAGIRSYTYDERTPKIFYVYPQPAPAKLVQVEMAVAMMPADVTADTSVLPLGDEYMGTLANYVLYRFYGKDAEASSSQTLALAQQYYQAFTTAIGNVTTLTTSEGAKQGRD